MYGISMNCRLAGAALAAALLFSGQALADDGDIQAAGAPVDDALVLGAAVAVSELDGERGTSGIAISVIDVEQTVNNSIDIDSGGGNVTNTNGAVAFAPGATTGNFSITSINTGNNNNMSNYFIVTLSF